MNETRQISRSGGGKTATGKEGKYNEAVEY